MGEDSNSKPKDFWDKVGVFSTFLSSVVIAIAALIVNSTLNARQQQRDNEARQQQHQLAKVQTLSSFMPHLSGTPESRETALYAIQALGYSDLATRLAQYTNSQTAGDTIMRTAFPSTPVRQEGEVGAQAPLPAAPQSSREGEIGWAYVGDYSDGTWRTRYLDFNVSELPTGLLSKVLRVRTETGALNVRAQMPNDNGEFSSVVAVLPPNAKIRILEVRQWSTTGYIWARVSPVMP